MPEEEQQTSIKPRAKRAPRKKWVGWAVVAVVLVAGYFIWGKLHPGRETDNDHGEGDAGATSPRR